MQNLGYAARCGPRLEKLGGQGIYFGSSSWKYDGWRGIVYDEGGGGDESYLKQYALVFPAVCADFTFYRFYNAGMFRSLYHATPPGFVFGLKVTQSLLIDRYPAWFKGENAGKVNMEFLEPGVFEEKFLAPASELKDRLGPIVFEFGEKTLALSPVDFVAAIDTFFATVPKGYQYAVEVRRKNFLTAEYFDALRRHAVAHVINSQQTAPPMREQLATYPLFTAPHSVIRALTPPRLSHKKSLERAEPFDRIVVEYPDGVDTIVEVAKACREAGRKLHAYINNRLEGCAPLTIERILDRLSPVDA